MMPMSTLLVFLAAALALVVIPGPNHLYIAARGIAQGRAAGVASAFGVEAGTLVHITAAAAGLSYVIARSAALFAVVKWVGVAYLAYLGVRALRGGRNADGLVPAAQPLRRIFLEGLLVNLLNPKVILFFLALLPQFVDPAGNVPLQVAALGLVLFTLGLASDMVYAVGLGAAGDRLRARAALLRYVSAAVYLVLAVVTAFSSGTARRAA